MNIDMDLKKFFVGLAFLIFGLWLLIYTVNNKAASSENNFKGEQPDHYVKNKPLGFLFIIGGIVFIIKSFIN